MKVNRNEMRSTLGALLRDQTRQAHTNIDQHPVLRPLISQHITLEQYAHALAALDALYGQMEAALGAKVTVGDCSFPCYPRAGFLTSDLKALGRLPIPDLASLAQTKPKSPSEALGVLYVLEGSALGGSMIYGRLGKALPDAPMRFFASGHESAQARWAQLQSFLSAVEGLIEPQQVVEAAERCFLALRQHLDCASALHLMSKLRESGRHLLGN